MCYDLVFTAVKIMTLMETTLIPCEWYNNLGPFVKLFSVSVPSQLTMAVMNSHLTIFAEEAFFLKKFY
jgi:hypothetical protein